MNKSAYTMIEGDETFFENPGDYGPISSQRMNSNLNQISSSKSFVGNSSHIPNDLRPSNIPKQVRFAANTYNEQNQFESPSQSIPEINFTDINQPGIIQDNLQCREVFMHVENCQLCKSYYNKDVKLYWIIIIILIVIILLLTRAK